MQTSETANYTDVHNIQYKLTMITGLLYFLQSLVSDQKLLTDLINAKHKVTLKFGLTSKSKTKLIAKTKVKTEVKTQVLS